MESNKKISIEIQHFEGCPNGPKLIENVKMAINGLENNIIYNEVLIEDNETANLKSFRGSPTLLINGVDFRNMPAPQNPSLTCRFYQSGIPKADVIMNKINKILVL